MSGPLVQALEKRRQEDLAKTQPLTPGTLEWAWAQAQKPFKGYWDRQGLMAREGLAMADQGAQQVRQGDLSGLAGMAFGPLNYLSSPINALFPIEEAQTQLPKSVSPFVAGGLELMALAAPGPKTKGLGRGVGALVDDVTDAERAALQSRLQTEATQTGGLPSSVTRDQALANLTEAPTALAEKIKAGWGKYDAMTTWRQDLEAMSGDDVAKVVESLGLRKSSSKKNNITAILGASSQAARDSEIAEKIRHGR